MDLPATREALITGDGDRDQHHGSTRAGGERAYSRDQSGHPVPTPVTSTGLESVPLAQASPAAPPRPASSSSDAHGDGGAGGRDELAASSSSVQLDVTDTAPRVETAKPPHQAPAPAKPAPSHSSSNDQAEGSRSTTGVVVQEERRSPKRRGKKTKKHLHQQQAAAPWARHPRPPAFWLPFVEQAWRCKHAMYEAAGLLQDKEDPAAAPSVDSDLLDGLLLLEGRVKALCSDKLQLYRQQRRWPGQELEQLQHEEEQELWQLNEAFRLEVERLRVGIGLLTTGGDVGAAAVAADGHSERPAVQDEVLFLLSGLFEGGLGPLGDLMGRVDAGRMEARNLEYQLRGLPAAGRGEVLRVLSDLRAEQLQLKRRLRRLAIDPQQQSQAQPTPRQRGQEGEEDALWLLHKRLGWELQEIWAEVQQLQQQEVHAGQAIDPALDDSHTCRQQLGMPDEQWGWPELHEFRGRLRRLVQAGRQQVEALTKEVEDLVLCQTETQSKLRDWAAELWQEHDLFEGWLLHLQEDESKRRALHRHQPQASVAAEVPGVRQQRLECRQLWRCHELLQQDVTGLRLAARFKWRRQGGTGRTESSQLQRWQSVRLQAELKTLLGHVGEQAEEAAAALVRELEAEEAANQARHNKKQEERRKDKDRQRQQQQSAQQQQVQMTVIEEEEEAAPARPRQPAVGVGTAAQLEASAAGGVDESGVGGTGRAEGRTQPDPGTSTAVADTGAQAVTTGALASTTPQPTQHQEPEQPEPHSQWSEDDLQLLDEEFKRLEEEEARLEAQRQAEEQKRKEEEDRLAAERQAEEQKRKEEEARLAAQRQGEEQRRKQEEARLAVYRQAQEQRRQEQVARLAAQRKAQEEARLAAQRQAEEQKRKEEEDRLAAQRLAEEQKRKEEEDRLAAERAREAAEEAAAALVRELEAEEAANQARHNKKQEKRRKDKDRQRQQRQQEEQARAEALAAQEEQRRRMREERQQRRQQEAEMKARAEQQQQQAAEAVKGPAMAGGVREGGVEPQGKDAVGSDGNRNKGKKEQQEEAHEGSSCGTAGSEDSEVDGGTMMMDMKDHLSCPISLVLMTDPVVAADGNTYQRDAIQAWIHRCTADGREVTSPLSGLPMAPELKPNNLVRCVVLESTKAGARGRGGKSRKGSKRC